MLELANLALDNVDRLERDIFVLSELVNQSWELKKQSNPFATTHEIDHLIYTGRSNGALGAKLLGAGESGFVLFICDSDGIKTVKRHLPEYNFMKVNMDSEGSHVVYDDGNQIHEF